MLHGFWKRVSDKNRLCYALVIAFGVCLLTLMLFFQFGYQLGERQIKPFLRQENISITEQKLLLIDEPDPIIRGIEVAISIGMITLGIDRLRVHANK